MDAVVEAIAGRRVALVVNQTSILEKTQVHLLDTLLGRGVDIKKVFAPEHGFRGSEEAGKHVDDSHDVKTGVPIFSLYGKAKKPTASQLEDVDVVVFDIQDVGVRFYTYISTMHYVMEACASNGKEFLVLDRPNPNDFVDGPVRRKGFESFVGLDPIPVLHGMTVGELACMINAEGWIADSCRVKVVPVKNWRHGEPYFLPVRPSPNLPNDLSVRLYASLGWFEGTNISIGRGTYYPFQVIGYPDEAYGTFTFTPRPIEGMDSNPLHREKTCYGVDLRELPFEGGLTLRFLLDFYERSGKKASFFARPEWFDLLAGESNLRMSIKAGLTEEEIRFQWQGALEEYKSKRRKYLLYPDYSRPKE
ncbi:MAG: DUF1343 domain-containing protein [Tannerellaceae bacterium]|nr:DUF1343 domain-containing protein [Tannerellaceae bacterium]